VVWVTGAAMILRKNVFEEIGGFDEKFFLFYEDADLCKRLTDAGYKIYYFPFSKIVHFKGENVNTDFESSTYFYSKQSQLLYYKKHNSFFDNLLLKIYLFFKFLFLYLVTFRKINLDILLLVLGIKK
jgi:GT2 family glycosyltransferase